MNALPLFVLWIITACGAYAVAKSRGRNYRLWFAVGLIIGPFAVLIVALLPLGANAKKGYH
ncbi:MAG: hypothetical protein R6W66_11255 [Pelovirga sp.]